jgi:hypothetical protein
MSQQSKHATVEQWLQNLAQVFIPSPHAHGAPSYTEKEVWCLWMCLNLICVRELLESLLCNGRLQATCVAWYLSSAQYLRTYQDFAQDGQQPIGLCSSVT